MCHIHVKNVGRCIDFEQKAVRLFFGEKRKTNKKKEQEESFSCAKQEARMFGAVPFVHARIVGYYASATGLNPAVIREFKPRRVLFFVYLLTRRK